MRLRKILISLVSLLTFVSMAGLLHAQNGSSTSQSTDKQSSTVLDAFEKNLDAQIATINKTLAQYNDLMNLPVTHTPVQSKFSKGPGYIELEKYDFVYESPNSTIVTGSKRKVIRLFYTGQSFSKLEATIMEENYVLKNKKLLKVTDPTPGTEDNGDIQISMQIDREPASEIKLSEMSNTISEPNRIKFKKEFYVEFLSNLEEDLMYTRKYVDMYSTNAHVNTIEELKRAVNY